MATVYVKQDKASGRFRLMQGNRPMGTTQRPARPTDGGGFATRAEAEALRAQILRRIEDKQ